MHRLFMLHRDMKPDNVVVFSNPAGPPTLKMADFGSARAYKHISNALPLADYKSPLTQNVCSHWYAAVELMLEDPRYSEKVGVWSIGCIIGKLVTGSPLFRGEENRHVVKGMQRQLGLITESNCPSARPWQGTSDWAKLMEDSSFANQTIAPDVPEWHTFIKQCLQYDSAQMPSAQTSPMMVPPGPGTCAATDESQAETSFACALQPGATRDQMHGTYSSNASLALTKPISRAEMSCHSPLRRDLGATPTPCGAARDSTSTSRESRNSSSSSSRRSAAAPWTWTKASCS